MVFMNCNCLQRLVRKGEDNSSNERKEGGVMTLGTRDLINEIW